jgi:hypothetical protein
MENVNGIRFERDEWGRLVLIASDGQQHVGVEPVRCFPMSDPTSAIAFLDADGREVVTVTDMSQLNDAARRTLETELTSRDFVPVIQKIISTTNPSPPCQWSVMTDRGTTQFQLESEDDIRKLSPDRVVIADSNGVRYEIRNVRDLDAHSKRIVQRLV